MVILTISSLIFLVEDVKKRTIDLTLSQMGLFLFKSQDQTEYSNYKKKKEVIYFFRIT